MIKVFVPRDAAALSMGADDVAKAIAAEAKKRNCQGRDRPQRLARHAVAGAAGRGRDAQRPRRLRPGETGRRSKPLQGQVPQRRKAQAFARPHRRDPILQEPGAPDVRALRHHRSAVDRGLPRSRRLCRPHQGAHHGAARHRHGGHDLRPARPRRRRLPDRHQVEDGPRRQGRPEVHLLQRRRGRQRHLRRPHADGRRPVLPHRRHDHRRHRRRRHQGLHLRPL